MKKRRLNERKYGKWKEMKNGGREYTKEVRGRNGWYAKYVKTVDEFETTLSFMQLIYDSKDELAEVHIKYPSDIGQIKLK